MSGRRRYFLKQRLTGLMIVAASLVAIPILNGDATHTIVFVPAGLFMMFTKEMCIYDRYYFEVRERRKTHDFNERSRKMEAGKRNEERNAEKKVYQRGV